MRCRTRLAVAVSVVCPGADVMSLLIASVDEIWVQQFLDDLYLVGQQGGPVMRRPPGSWRQEQEVESLVTAGAQNPSTQVGFCKKVEMLRQAADEL